MINKPKIPSRFYTNTYEMAQLQKLTYQQVKTYRKELKIKPQKGMSPTVWNVQEVVPVTLWIAKYYQLKDLILLICYSEFEIECLCIVIYKIKKHLLHLLFMLKSYKQVFRSHSLPKTLCLLPQKLGSVRGRNVRRNAIKFPTHKKFEAPMVVTRRKSCEGDLFGYFKTSKQWMQWIKIDNPQHRNQNLAKIVFMRLKHGSSINTGPAKRMATLKKCFKDQVNLLRILSTFKPKQVTAQSENVIRIKKHNFSHLPSPKNNSRVHTQLFPFNKSITIEQPLFPKKTSRNLSQQDLQSPHKNLTQPTFASPRRFKKSIMNIYGISNTMQLIKY